MDDFIEVVDEEYESLMKRGIALIEAETKESIKEWLRCDNINLAEEQELSFLSGEIVTV